MSHIFTVPNSSNLSEFEITHTLGEEGYHPIFAQRDQDNNIRYTTIPFDIPPCLQRIPVEIKEMNSDYLDQVISLESNSYHSAAPFLIDGKLMSTSIETLKENMAKECGGVSRLVKEIPMCEKEGGVILDLGSGVGGNALHCLEKNWKIVAIDQYESVLNIFKKILFCRGQNATVIHGDINKEPFSDEAFDKVLIIDVLSYIQPTDLISVIQKIHAALIEDGEIIGSLFFENSCPNQMISKFMRHIGASLYSDEAIIYPLLEMNGFKEVKAFRRDGMCADSFVAIEFTAKKAS
ncbi:MAG: class I SAM-dependent methyltransferase [Simkaniaceae bacterium]